MLEELGELLNVRERCQDKKGTGSQRIENLASIVGKGVTQMRTAGFDFNRAL
jgi:hypothetical protein